MQQSLRSQTARAVSSSCRRCRSDSCSRIRDLTLQRWKDINQHLLLPIPQVWAEGDSFCNACFNVLQKAQRAAARARSCRSCGELCSGSIGRLSAEKWQHISVHLPLQADVQPWGSGNPICGNCIATLRHSQNQNQRSRLLDWRGVAQYVPVGPQLASIFSFPVLGFHVHIKREIAPHCRKEIIVVRAANVPITAVSNVH